LSKKQATAGKPQKTFPQTIYTCAQLATAKNTYLIWKRDASALYPYVSPLLNETSYCRENPSIKIPTNNVHVHSWPPL
jgi:hypothetical protein